MVTGDAVYLLKIHTILLEWSLYHNNGIRFWVVCWTLQGGEGGGGRGGNVDMHTLPSEC